MDHDNSWRLLPMGATRLRLAEPRFVLIAARGAVATHFVNIATTTTPHSCVKKPLLGMSRRFVSTLTSSADHSRATDLRSISLGHIAKYSRWRILTKEKIRRVMFWVYFKAQNVG